MKYNRSVSSDLDVSWFVASTIIQATGLAQLKEENIDVVGVDLPDAVLREIDAIHQRYPNPALQVSQVRPARQQVHASV